MPIITQLPQHTNASLEKVKVCVNRHTLQKKHWRIAANDGEDIAVELSAPCKHGDIIYVTDKKSYIIEQEAEPLLYVHIPKNSDEAALLGWLFGNQHIPIEVKNGDIYLADEATIRQLLERNHIHFHAEESIFSPSPHSKGAHHHHHHHH